MSGNPFADYVKDPAPDESGTKPAASVITSTVKTVPRFGWVTYGKWAWAAKCADCDLAHYFYSLDAGKLRFHTWPGKMVGEVSRRLCPCCGSIAQPLAPRPTRDVLFHPFLLAMLDFGLSKQSGRVIGYEYRHAEASTWANFARKEPE